MDVPAFVWMFVVLKIPVVLALWLIWWAIREPEPVMADDQDDGGSDRHEPLPRNPRPPRRGGPHANPPPAPPRVRTPARSRDTTRS
jgi:hypothetical protein